MSPRAKLKQAAEVVNLSPTLRAVLYGGTRPYVVLLRSGSNFTLDDREAAKLGEALADWRPVVEKVEPSG